MTTMDPAMLGLANRIAGFIRSGDDRELDSVFAREVTIIENFAPHIFRDVATWREAMRAHLHSLSDMQFVLGQPMDFSVTGGRAFFCVPVTWTGKLHGRPFRELGGKSLVLQKEDGAWRVAAYAWAVIEMRFL